MGGERQGHRLTHRPVSPPRGAARFPKPGAGIGPAPYQVMAGWPTGVSGRSAVGISLRGPGTGLCVGVAGPSATTPGYSPANLAIITEAVMIRRAQAEASQPGNEVLPLSCRR